MKQNKVQLFKNHCTSVGACSFKTVKSCRDNKADMITINSYAQKEINFSDLIDGENYNKLPEVKRIYFVYQNKRNHTRKILIKKDFKIANIETSESQSFL